MSRDPIVVASTGNEIATLDIPAGFNPEFSMDLELPQLGEIVKAAGYTTSDKQELLVLATVGDIFSKLSIDEIAARIRSASTSNASQSNLDVVNSHVEKVTIRGQEIEVTINEVKDQSTQKLYWKVIAPFQGNDGLSFIILVLSQDRFTEEQVKHILESIK